MEPLWNATRCFSSARRFKHVFSSSNLLLFVCISACYDSVQENSTAGVVTFNYTANTLLFQEMQTNITRCFNSSDTVSIWWILINRRSMINTNMGISLHKHNGCRGGILRNRIHGWLPLTEGSVGDGDVDYLPSWYWTSDEVLGKQQITSPLLMRWRWAYFNAQECVYIVLIHQFQTH